MVERPQILAISDEPPRHKRRKYGRGVLSSIRYIVVHHGAALGDGLPRIRAYARYHVESLGWPGIGYHFGVTKDGTIYRTNPLEVISYHVGGYTSRSVGVVLVGHYDVEDPPSEQMAAAKHLCAWLCSTLGLGPESVRGHREFPGAHKTCPRLKISMASFRGGVRRILEGEEEPPAVKVIFEGRETRAILREGRTYVPLRELCDLLGLEVEWNRQRRAAIVGGRKEG